MNKANDSLKNNASSGVKDFSWTQAKRNATIKGKLRNKDEVQNSYFELIFAYHLARRGVLDLPKQLEKWVLEN